jgi:ribosome-associated toxin RatA of RatAB toxin-antitoxin module
VLKVDRSAQELIPLPPERCVELVGVIEALPTWSSLISSVDVLESDDAGLPTQARLHAGVMGLTVQMPCNVERSDDGATLRRIRNGTGKDEDFVAIWSAEPHADGTEMNLHVTAELNVPGPARLLRGQVGNKLCDELLADFAKYASADPA